jgi:predicted Co/Zn/Cd cation transporter (cation efflux family)
MRGVTGVAGVQGIQHTLARRRSIAARGLGLGMKGYGQWVISVAVSVVVIVAFVIAWTAKAVAVARGRFAQVRRSQVPVMCSGIVFAEAVGFVESALVSGDVELPLLHLVADPTESHVRSFGMLLFD